MPTRYLGGARAIALACLFAFPALAQTGPTITAPAGAVIPSTGVAYGAKDSTATYVDATHGLPVNCITGCSGGGGGGGGLGGVANATAPTLTEGQAVTTFNFDLGSRLRTTSIITGSVAVTGTFWQATQPVSAASLPLPTGAATSAKQDTLVTAVGAPVIASSNFTTPSGTTAYASGNLIANSATAGSVTPLSFGVCSVTAGHFQITGARIKSTDTAFASATVRLHLHRDTPAYTNGDHAAWLTTDSTALDDVDVTFDRTFSDVVKGWGKPNHTSLIVGDCASGTTTISGELEVRGAVTPAGSKVFTVVLEVVQAAN